MEYFVVMTTHVPEGTPPAAVDDVRSREAVSAGTLASEGHLLRLWRPPLAPGEWRTFGLFAADDGDQLDELLGSMPLHIWRTDDVTPLSIHPNDPGKTTGRASAEFLTEFGLAIPDDAGSDLVSELLGHEADSARELAGAGTLVRLWALPNRHDEQRALGLWSATDADELASVLESLPLRNWMSIEVTPLSPHPNDPAGTGRA
ncbi:MAG TPA: muconolactone Delta-isomerase family protein [Mycobacterium sp.]|nr:muconolactone Delta-isomerase family protein [Mycobacterium sp.]